MHIKLINIHSDMPVVELFCPSKGGDFFFFLCPPQSFSVAWQYSMSLQLTRGSGTQNGETGGKKNRRKKRDREKESSQAFAVQHTPQSSRSARQA